MHLEEDLKSIVGLESNNKKFMVFRRHSSFLVPQKQYLSALTHLTFSKFREIAKCEKIGPK